MIAGKIILGSNEYGATVVRTALQDAASVAGLLVTTEAVGINLSAPPSSCASPRRCHGGWRTSGYAPLAALWRPGEYRQ